MLFQIFQYVLSLVFDRLLSSLCKPAQRTRIHTGLQFLSSSHWIIFSFHFYLNCVVVLGYTSTNTGMLARFHYINSMQDCDQNSNSIKKNGNSILAKHGASTSSSISVFFALYLLAYSSLPLFFFFLVGFCWCFYQFHFSFIWLSSLNTARTNTCTNALTLRWVNL